MRVGPDHNFLVVPTGTCPPSGTANGGRSASWGTTSLCESSPFFFANFFSSRVVVVAGVVAPSSPLPSVAPHPLCEPLVAADNLPPLVLITAGPASCLACVWSAAGATRAAAPLLSRTYLCPPFLALFPFFFSVFPVGSAPLPFAARLPRGCLPPLGVFPRWPGHV